MTEENKRNTGQEKKKENKKFPYKSGRKILNKNKKGGIGDIFGAIGFLLLGFILGHLMGDRLLNAFTELIGRLITNGFSGGV